MAIIWNNSSMSQITGHRNELVTTSCHFLPLPTSLPFVTIFVFKSAFWGNIDRLDVHVYLHLEKTKRGLYRRSACRRSGTEMRFPSSPLRPLKNPLTRLLCLTFHCWAKLDFAHLFLWMEFVIKERLFSFSRWISLKCLSLAKVNP